MADMEVGQGERAAGPFLRGRQHTAGGLARRTLLTAGGFVLVLFLLYPTVGSNGLGAYLHLRRERDRLQEEVARLRHERERLEDHLRRLRDDPEELERLARENYNLRHPGETMLRLVPESEAARRSP
ncbi:MAG: septum formation initiator family protein [Candidatus Krumholzibacteriia bacterium]